MARFCPWYPLAEAWTRTPDAPGVVQVRVAEGLLDYPTGKSAMVHYAAGPSARAAALAYGEGRSVEGLLCRHLEEAPTDPAATLAELLARFERRFGARPGATRS